MTHLSPSTPAIAEAIAAASLSDKLTHVFIATHCPSVSYRADSGWQTHGFTSERRIEARCEVIYAAIALQSEIDEANEVTDSIDEGAIDNRPPGLDANEAIATAKATAYAARDAAYIRQGKIADYIASATLFVMGVAAGLVLACLAASAVLSNLPQ